MQLLFCRGMGIARCLCGRTAHHNTKAKLASQSIDFIDLSNLQIIIDKQTTNVLQYIYRKLQQGVHALCQTTNLLYHQKNSAEIPR